MERLERGCNKIIQLSKDFFRGLETVGAFVLYQEKFAFMIGPDKTDQKLGIVRFGGHIEAGEDALDCLAREILEEASTLSEPGESKNYGGSLRRINQIRGIL